ncbi:aspartate aminotransferase [Strigomonas culicis]|uniref:Aspartate aminotransferase n=1 Tax=Strigomonas culicis TaxID=28005 RepID=S9V787_9TRYP|nr:aspartate aminotransferase [Strigomonas culicis]|eukprot:EPY36683.1 aspartate aminotransferase [Strigomonas culicis]
MCIRTDTLIIIPRAPITRRTKRKKKGNRFSSLFDLILFPICIILFTFFKKKKMNGYDFFAGVPQATPDSLLSIAEKAQKAQGKKANLIVGAYRDECGLPYPLPVVQKAEERVVAAKLDHEYLPSTGHPGFVEAALKMLYGDTYNADKMAGVQSLSGTGALTIGALYLHQTLSLRLRANGGALEALPAVYVSDPTWPNHFNIFQAAGFARVETYRYYDATRISFDLEGMVADVRGAPEGSIFVLHQCAHNPTGVDPTEEEWGVLADTFAEKRHIIFFDSAYQGYASGNLDRDAFAVRLFVRRGFPFLCAQSFAKNLGLYGERIGLLSAVLGSPDQRDPFKSQCVTIIRAQYSNPPTFGARLVHTILTDPELRAQWQQELDHMSGRIKKMRALVRKHLEETYKTPGTWSHITKQIGMFSFLGLSKEECAYCQEHNVFITLTGRANMAGLTEETAELLAKTIDGAVRKYRAADKL